MAVRRLVARENVESAALGAVKAASLVQRLARKASVRRKKKGEAMVALLGRCVGLKEKLGHKVKLHREFKAKMDARQTIESKENEALRETARDAIRMGVEARVGNVGVRSHFTVVS